MIKRIFYIVFLATMLYSCQKPISEFQSANFIKFFGSGYQSKGNDVIELSEGGYVITGYDKINGSDNQILAAKVDINGNLVWSRTYGSRNSDEEGRIVKELSDGLLIAGTSTGASGITHSFIMKTNMYGDSLWSNEFGDKNFNIVVNDIIVNADYIYVAGQSDSTKVNKSDYYSAKLKLSPDSVQLVWNIFRFTGTNSSFERVFLKNQNMILVGTYGYENRISIATLQQDNGSEMNFEYTESMPLGTVSDVSMAGDLLYVLANNSSGTQLFKLNASHTVEWPTDIINSVSGKAVAYNEDGTLMVCGESTVEGNTLINFIKVDAAGSAVYGSQSFKTYQGTIGRIKPTQDKGLILVGTTNPTFGANVQLIKTDKDLFLLKP